MVWIQIFIIQCMSNDALVRMIKELLQRIIEQMERNDCPRFRIHKFYGRFLKKSQHGTLTLSQVLAGCAMGSDRGQYTTEQVKLIGDKGIYLCKILPPRIQLFLNAIIEQNQVLDDGFLCLVIQGQCLCCGVRFLQNTLPDNLIYICR